MLSYDTRDESEQIYLAKFIELASAHGITINYAIDRAALDLGLHLTVPIRPRMKGVSSSRVWFQFKGKSESSLTREEFGAASTISQSVEIEHLRQWYRYGEPVYLTVYVESADKFFAVDIQKMINERWGDSVFRNETFTNDKGRTNNSVTIHLPKASSEVGESFWEELRKHRSMRTDLSTYQGRPLAHSYDIQSRIPQMMDPSLFEDLIGELLAAHRFRLWGIANDISALYPNAIAAGDRVTIMIGKLFEPLQYDLYLTRELLTDETGYREDGQQFRVQGRCAVVIHGLAKSKPASDGVADFAEFLKSEGISNVLVFVNHYMTSVAKWDDQQEFNCFPEFSEGFTKYGIDCVPLHLEDLGKTILTTTKVYLEYREDIVWLDEILQRKTDSGRFKVMSPAEYFDALENDPCEE